MNKTNGIALIAIAVIAVFLVTAAAVDTDDALAKKKKKNKGISAQTTAATAWWRSSTSSASRWWFSNHYHSSWWRGQHHRSRWWFSNGCRQAAELMIGAAANSSKRSERGKVFWNRLRVMPSKDIALFPFFSFFEYIYISSMVSRLPPVP